MIVPVLSSKQRIHIAGRLNRAARHREDVMLNKPVHAGDADGRQQSADRRRDQADEQRHQYEDDLRRAE